MIQFTVRQLAEVENNMNSTERIHFYGTQLEEEAPLHLGDVPANWPEKGEIVFEDVQMRYRAGLPLVLHGLSMHVNAGERIGVVGRTGAGKSSIMSTLFRLVELSGGKSPLTVSTLRLLVFTIFVLALPSFLRIQLCSEELLGVIWTHLENAPISTCGTLCGKQILWVLHSLSMMSKGA